MAPFLAPKHDQREYQPEANDPPYIVFAELEAAMAAAVHTIRDEIQSVPLP